MTASQCLTHKWLKRRIMKTKTSKAKAAAAAVAAAADVSAVPADVTTEPIGAEQIVTDGLEVRNFGME